MSTLLSKGLEEEAFTGTPDGRIVGFAGEIAAALPGFRTEPDRRNPEFATPPFRGYDELGRCFLAHRHALRRWLRARGDYTIVPGATLGLGDSSVFEICDETNDYYRFIRDTYGTRVVTASAHVSLGIDDPETIVRASRVLRMEACLYLALTAASPFLDGRATGWHSTRWATFPQTPADAPLFTSADDYAAYVEAAVADGRMRSTRHLWTSARPNGPRVPHELNRVELRVCDRVDDHRVLLAVTALAEARVQQIIADPGIDPLAAEVLPAATRAEDLAGLSRANDEAVARSSLEAEVWCWRTGRRVPVREWIGRQLDEATRGPGARAYAAHLEPLRDVLRRGNAAMRWLEAHRGGAPVTEVVRRAVLEAAASDAPFDGVTCGASAAADAPTTP